MTPTHRHPSQGSHYLELTCAQDGKLTTGSVMRMHQSRNDTNWWGCRKVFIFRQKTCPTDRFGLSQELCYKMAFHCKGNYTCISTIRETGRGTMCTYIWLTTTIGACVCLWVYARVYVCVCLCVFVCVSIFKILRLKECKPWMIYCAVCVGFFKV